MNILLVNPPSPYHLSNIYGKKSSWLDIGSYHPLGLMYLAGYLLEHSNHDVEILDMEAKKTGVQGLRETIKTLKPDVIGVHANTFLLDRVYEVVREARASAKDAHITLGGPHTEVFPGESLSLPEVDSIVIGEGEETLLELLDSLEKRRNLSSVRGLGYKKGGTPQINNVRPLIEDLDKLSFPARQLVSPGDYSSLIGKKKASTSIMSSRGCPFRCNFCYVLYGGRYRRRSVKNVIDEIKACVAMGIHEFMFFDETFGLERAWVVDFCGQVIKNRLDIVFDVRTRINILDEEMLFRLKKVGCIRIKVGVESGTQEILNRMNKQLSLGEITRSFKLIKKSGISSYASFMIGYPGETMEQISETFSYIMKLEPDYAQVMVTKLAPATKLYRDALDKGVLTRDYWREFALNPVLGVNPPLATDRFKEEELDHIISRFYRKFYFRPKTMFGRMLKVESPRELKNLFKAGYGFFIHTFFDRDA